MTGNHRRPRVTGAAWPPPTRFAPASRPGPGRPLFRRRRWLCRASRARFSDRLPRWHLQGWCCRRWLYDRTARKVVRIWHDRPSWATTRTARQFNRITAGQRRRRTAAGGLRSCVGCHDSHFYQTDARIFWHFACLQRTYLWLGYSWTWISICDNVMALRTWAHICQRWQEG